MLFSFLVLLAAHWAADFVLQTDWQAQNKSKSVVALASHVFTYTLAMFGACIIWFGMSTMLVWFMVINALLHFITDYFTSRRTALLWKRQERHNFFAMVGFDQLIHQITLAGTMVCFLS